MKFITSLVTLAGIAAAQQPLYGQCGGQGWTGSTTCAAGSTCAYSNQWYSQCLPGTAGASSTLATSVIPSSTAQPGTTKTSTAAGGGATGSFARVDGLKFNIDGKTGYFAGTNCYWCGFLSNVADMNLVLDHMAASGLKILRIWGFNDVNSKPGSSNVWFQYLSSSGSEINTGANGLQLLDSFVKAAGQRGIKLIINFVNNWDDYGGMKAYTTAFGGDHQGWYTNAAAQAQYQKYIAAVVSRYKSDPTIFAWELSNEARCNGCSTNVIYDWAVKNSAYVKSLDPNHMVTLGDEGFGVAGGDGSYPYQTGEGLDWSRLLGIKNLDFGTFHLYPSTWGQEESWGSGWVEAHGKACASAGKPCMVEEYGTPSNHCAIEGPWQKAALAASGISADLYWQWGDVLSTGKSSDDGNTIYYGSNDDFKCLVTNHVAALPK